MAEAAIRARDRLARSYRRALWISRRAGARLRSGGPAIQRLPIVFANAIPKSGSNLLFNIVRRLPTLGPFVDSGQPVIKPYTDGQPTPTAEILRELDLLRPGDVRCGYLYATAENQLALARPGWASFFILRDPRDTIVSVIYYATGIHPGHALHDYLLALPDMERRVETLIRGIRDGPEQRAGVAEQYTRFTPWVEHPQVFTVRFEDLVTNPDATLARMLEHLEGEGFELPPPREAAVAKLRAGMDPSRSNTFRKGKPGAWVDHFSEANKNLFKDATGDLLVRLGYETDMDW